jgi:hypothetical protein
VGLRLRASRSAPHETGELKRGSAEARRRAAGRRAWRRRACDRNLPEHVLFTEAAWKFPPPRNIFLFLSCPGLNFLLTHLTEQRRIRNGWRGQEMTQ